MSNRRSILSTEEGVSTPGSPLRRSTRIANSPAPAPAAAPTTTTSAAVSRRRSSAAESTVSTPAKLTRLKRQSLSHEITLEESTQTPSKHATAKTPTADSRSPSAEPDVKEAAAAAGTPAKRGRKPSLTKLKEEEAAAKPETPTRRRSIRGQSTSPSKDNAAEPPVAKPRGRRASINQANLEVISETTPNEEPKKVGRPARTTRRISMDMTEEVDTKKEEKKPATRRSIRGRSNSVDIPEEPEVKATQELIPINEEEPVVETKATEKKPEVEIKATEKKPEEVEVKKTEAVEENKKTGDDSVQVPGEIEISEQKAEVEKVIGMEVDGIEDKKGTTTPIPQIQEVEKSSPSRMSRKSESDSVFKSPVRRSPRLSASPVTISPETKSSPIASSLADADDKPSPTSKTKANELSQKSPSVDANVSQDSPIKLEVSPMKSPSENQSENKLTDSPRRSLRLSESHETLPVVAPRRKSSSFSETNSNDCKIEASPRRSLSLRLSQGENKEETVTAVAENESAADVVKADSSTLLVKNEDNVILKPRRSSRIFESSEVSNAKDKRKSNSFSENEEKTTTIRLSKSFGESTILNTSNLANTNSKTPSRDLDATKTTKKDSILKRTPEMVYGSDGSFQLNLSIPTTNNSTDIEDGDGDKAKNVAETTILDISGNSNNSDKENGDKLNVPKSPRNKRVSLSDSSTPKLNSIKMQSFCEPIEVEFATDVVVASAQVVPKTPVIELGDSFTSKTLKSSQNESILEVDNENEFGTSPVKAMKRVSRDVTQSEDELEEELMSSFVDEVLEIDDDDNEVETKDEDKNSSVKETPAETTTETTKERLNTSKKQKGTPGKKEKHEIVESKIVETTVILDSDSDEEQIVGDDEDDEDISDEIAEADEAVVEVKGGSKRRKIADNISQKLDDLINAKLKQTEESSEEEDDDDKPRSEFIDDMAFEGEEDTPSEDSNQLVDDGESLHSSESDCLDDDDDYENDSFITDDDCVDLLSGNEFDLEELNEDKKKNEKKKRKSRIIQNVDSSDDEQVTEREEEKKSQVVNLNDDDDSEDGKVMKTESADKTMDKDESIDPDSSSGKIVVLQNIKITSPAKDDKNESVVINEKDNLKSLEAMKDTLNIDVPRDPKPSLSTPNNSMIESPTRKPRRKTSLSIQDQIKISRFSDGEITDKITKAVDFFVSSIKEKSGNVSVNVSLDYANNSTSSADEGTPKKAKRVSLKREDVANINNVVDQILETTVNERNQQQDFDVECIEGVKCLELNENKAMSKKQKKRNSNVSRQNTSLQDEFVVDEVEIQNKSVSKKNKSKKRVSQGFNEIENNDVVEVPDNVEKPTVKAGKKRLNSKNISFSRETEYEINNTEVVETSEEESPKKKLKLNKSLSDIDVVPEVKTKKSKKEKRLSVNKSLDSAALEMEDDVFEVEPEIPIPTPVQKKSKKNKKKAQESVELETDNEEKESEFVAIPAKKSKLSKFLPKMFVEDELEAFVTKSEIAQPSTSKSVSTSTGAKKKLKKVKPSVSNDFGDDDWSVQTVVAEKPSRKNKDKVKVQLDVLKKKLAPNDFKNQMIYGSSVKRMDSKDILKNKQKAGFTNRKQK